MNALQNKCLQFMRGYLEITIKGDYIERFLNMCRAHQIFIWNIKNQNQIYTCRVASADFAQMVPLVRKTGTKVEVTQKKGLPFYFPFLKKRILFFIGVLLCLGMLYAVTDYVWAIEYVGNHQISDDELHDFMQQEKICYGMKKEDIDCEEEEKKLRAAFDNVTWTSIYFQGTKLYVEIKENEKKEPIQKKMTQGSDIVATETGTIASIITRNGIPKVKVGDTVEAGQILVEGRVPVYDEGQNIISYHIYDADADIRLQTTMSHTETVSNMYATVVYSGRKKKTIFIEIGGYHIESPDIGIYSYECSEKITQRRQVVLLDHLYLPIFYGTTLRKEYHLEYFEYTNEQMNKILSDKFETFILCLQEKGVQIIEKNVKIGKNRNGMELKADIVLIKPTGKNTTIFDNEQQKE